MTDLPLRPSLEADEQLARLFEAIRVAPPERRLETAVASVSLVPVDPAIWRMVLAVAAYFAVQHGGDLAVATARALADVNRLRASWDLPDAPGHDR